VRLQRWVNLPCLIIVASTTLSDYENYVAKAAEYLRTKGDLKGYLTLDSELKRFRSSNTVSNELADVHSLLANAVAQWNDAMGKARSHRNERKASLMNAYLSRLRAIVQEYTVSGDIEAAKRFQDEVDRMEFVLAEFQVSHPVVSESISPAEGRKRIPEGAVEFGGHHYKVFLEGEDWRTAKAKCEELGGHLVTITSASENECVTKIAGKQQRMWIGASNSIRGKWSWVTGEKFEFSPLGPSMVGRQGRYLFTHGERGTDWTGRWSDRSDVYDRVDGYICEWDSHQPMSIGTSPAMSTRSRNPVPLGTKSFGGHHYKVFVEGEDWKTAKAKCEEMGGHLVTITSRAEHEFLTQLLGKTIVPSLVRDRLLKSQWENSFGDKGQVAYAWMGFTDDAKEGQWEWITGEPVTFTSWRKTEPNGKRRQNIALFNAWGGWEALKGTRRYPYTCEWDY